MREKIYISTQEFHDFIKIYPVKLHCYLLVQKSDYLPITCTAPVSFAHFHAHSSVSYFSMLMVSIHTLYSFHYTAGGEDEMKSLLPLIPDTELMI